MKMNEEHYVHSNVALICMYYYQVGESLSRLSYPGCLLEVICICINISFMAEKETKLALGLKVRGNPTV